ncbi:MAG: THUMP domain-containing protein [Burkholderiales bacterium]|nr:THUMP domain-containing protein [Burkholderiales bacterium]
MPDTPFTLFSPCPRGLEPVLAGELAALGASACEAVPGGVRFRGDLALCYRANLESRIATRVLLRVHEAPYRSEDDVYRAAFSVRWRDWFDVRRSIRVDTTAIRSPLRSIDFVTLRVKDAVCDRFRKDDGARPDVDTRAPDVRIHVFLDERSVTLYLDTSGEPLFKRGIRGRAGEAPLKENLAAGIIRLAGWDGVEPFLDPMCGGGTFLIEAAQIALGIAPGARREFGFERLANFDAALWKRLREAAEARVAPRGKLPVFGSDKSGRAVASAREALAAAGLADFVTLKQCDVLELTAPARWGVMVANPPYGVRLDDKARLAAFYPKLGDALKARFAGWRCYLFTADLEAAKLIGLRPSKRTPLFNGPLECRLFEFRIVAGSMRRGGG